MDEDLPTEFDLVVVGTGFVESIVAAAASRIGKTVLHIDPNDFYGGTWASFNLDALQSFISSIAESPATDESKQFNSIKNASQIWHVTTPTATPADDAIPEGQEATEKIWTKENVLKEFRRFNVDLSPKLLFSCGKLVKLLISSNICRYAEFRAVDHVCTIINGQTRSVPCSRTDVFNTKDLSIVEKRLLMKLLTSCMGYDEHPEEFKDYEDKTFLEYLKSVKLTDNIIHCVLYSISMSNEQTSLKDGIDNTKKFLNSLGRYGNTPFLFPMYGCGEIPQCFCRLCAVFGGIYCLKRSVSNVSIADAKVDSIKCGNQDIKASNIVVGHGNILPDFSIPAGGTGVGKKCGGISRAIYITSSPLGAEELNSSGGGVNFLKLTDESGTGAFVLQLSHYSGTCPKGLYLIHISCSAKSNNPEADIKPYLDKLLTTDHPPAILYSIYFTIDACLRCTSGAPITNDSLSNVFVCCGPSFELDYDESIDNAEGIFKKIYPEDEFLPRAPDPEEIVIGDEDPVSVADDVITLDSVKEQIMELEAGLLHQEDCMEENSRNEEMAMEVGEE